MNRTLRALFLGRLLREKLLLVVFALIGVGWWLSSFSARANTFGLQRRRTTAALLEQKQWIDNRAAIEAAAQKAAAQLDPAKTLDGPHLYSTIQALAAEAGISRNTRQSPQADAVRGQLTVHTLDYTIQGIEGLPGWLSLLKFYAALRDRSPYIAIEKFSMTMAQGNSTQHTAQLTVSSVENTR